MDALFTFLNRLPNNTYPFTYDPTQDSNIFSLVFWWRELWHFLGGIFLGIIAPAPIVLAAFIYKEWLDDCSQSFSNWNFKNTADVSAWALGALLSNSILFFFWNIYGS